jgi:hypothetical protein
MEVALLIDPSLNEINSLAVLASKILVRQLRVRLSAVIFFKESEPKFLMPTSLMEFIGKLNKLLHKNSPSSLDWNSTKEWLIDSWNRKKKDEKLIYKFIHIRKNFESTSESGFWDITSLIDYFEKIWMMKLVNINKETNFFVTPISSSFEISKTSLKISSKASKYPLICYQAIPVEFQESLSEENFIWELENGIFLDKENLYEPIPEGLSDPPIPNYNPNRFDIIEIFLQNYFGTKGRPLLFRSLLHRFSLRDLNRYKPLLLTASDPFIREYVQALVSNENSLIKSFTEIYIGYQNSLSDVLFPECNEVQRFERYYMLSIELQISGVKSIPLVQYQIKTANPSMEKPYLKTIFSSDNSQLISTRVGKLNYQIKALYSSFFNNLN